MIRFTMVFSFSTMLLSRWRCFLNDQFVSNGYFLFFETNACVPVIDEIVFFDDMVSLATCPFFDVPFPVCSSYFAALLPLPRQFSALDDMAFLDDFRPPSRTVADCINATVRTNISMTVECFHFYRHSFSRRTAWPSKRRHRSSACFATAPTSSRRPDPIIFFSTNMAFAMMASPRRLRDHYRCVSMSAAGAVAAGRVHRVANRHRIYRRYRSPAAPGPVQALRLHLRVPVSGDAQPSLHSEGGESCRDSVCVQRKGTARRGHSGTMRRMQFMMWLTSPPPLCDRIT